MLAPNPTSLVRPVDISQQFLGKVLVVENNNSYLHLYGRHHSELLEDFTRKARTNIILEDLVRHSNGGQFGDHYSIETSKGIILGGCVAFINGKNMYFAYKSGHFKGVLSQTQITDALNLQTKNYRLNFGRHIRSA